MKSSWEMYPLAKLASVFTDGNWIETKDQSDEGIRLVQTGNIGAGIFKDRSEKARYIDEKTFARLKCFEVLPGDLLISRLPDPVGRACIVPDVGQKMITAVDCSIVRAKETVVDPRFLVYYMQSTAYLREVDERCTGTTRRRISRKNLGNVLIPLPPLDEQKRIVSILDQAFAALDRARENAEANLGDAEALFENFLTSAFQSSGSEWEVSDFGDQGLLKIIDGDRGKNYPKKEDFSSSGDCLFLSTKNVRPDGFEFSELMFISREKDFALSKGKLSRRDVVLTTRGTVGNVALFDDSVPFDDIRINSGMLILRPCEKYLRGEYLVALVRSKAFKEQLARHVSGAAQPQLPIRSLRQFYLPKPKTISEQTVIVKSLERLEERCAALKSNYQTLIENIIDLRQSLLQKAFSGQLT